MQIENFIAKRYLIAKKSSGTKLITKVAIIGLILAVSSLITVLSIINGFHKNLTDGVLGSISHGYINSINGFEDIAKTQNIINSHPEILASNVFIENYALISYRGDANGVSVRGIDSSEQQATDIWEDFKGSTNIERGQVVIGTGLAKKINAQIGDKINLITPELNKSFIGITPRVKRLEVAGIFSGRLNEYDTSLVFINLADADALYRMNGDIDGIRVKVSNIIEAKRIINEVVDNLGENYYGVSWQQQKRNFFTALKTERIMIAVVLIIIVIVSIFNIVSMMIVLIKDKKYDIAILRTIGFKAKQVKRTMFLLGLKIGLFAIGLGVILGLLLSYFIGDIINVIEKLFGVKFFPDDVFYINSFPSEILFLDIALVLVISFSLVVAASIYAAQNSAKINISQTLKEL